MSEDARVSEDTKTPVERAVEQAVDVFVHAPIGLVFDGPGSLPALIKAGRAQVANARLIGQFAIQQGQVEATRALARVQAQAAGVLGLLGHADGAPRSVSTQSRPAEHAAPAEPAEPADHAAPAEAEMPAAELAIPDYDSLSASQVVTRLAGLSAAELDAVRAYETANRGRKTILSKIAQLERS
jgi:hypothetical protein